MVGLTFTANYTYSKSIDDASSALTRFTESQLAWRDGVFRKLYQNARPR